MTARAPALVLLVALHAAGAQSTREVRVDAGAAQVQQTGRSARDAAGVFGLSWREGSPLVATLLSGAITVAGDSNSASQASLAAAWRPTERSAWLSEGGISGAAFGSSILSRGGSFSGFVRERFALEAAGLWAGAAFGGTSRDNLASHSTALEVGAWWHLGALEASGSLGRVRSDDLALLEAAGIFLSRDAASFDLTDATTEFRLELGPVVLDATGTLRHGARATSAAQSAFYASAIWTLSPRYSFTFGTGRLLADPVRGIPDMQITSATVRVALVPARTTGPAAAARGAAFTSLTRKASGALLVVHVIAGDTALVEIAGSFSQWKPVPLTRTADGWEAEIALPPGTHRVAVRIDGGPWQAPRGTARMKDEFGGESGLIVVP